MLIAGMMVGLGLAIVLVSSATLTLLPTLPHYNVPYWAGIPLFITGLVASCYCILEITSITGKQFFFYVKVRTASRFLFFSFRMKQFLFCVCQSQLYKRYFFRCADASS